MDIDRIGRRIEEETLQRVHTIKPVSPSELEWIPLARCFISGPRTIDNAKMKQVFQNERRGEPMQLTIPIPECQDGVRLPAGIFKWSEEEFFQFCLANRDLRIERSPSGEIIVMSPAGGYASFQNLKAASQLDAWATKDGSGVAFDSSAGFRLPNGAMRSPDAAWVRRARVEKLSHREKDQFIPLCPDFVIEVASPSDEVASLREKMAEYVGCGLRLGWLILPASTQVEVYSPAGVETLNSPATMSADPVLPGFKLELASIWNPPF